MTAHPEETFAALVKSDEQLKSLPIEKYGILASPEVLAKTKEALEAKKVRVIVVDTGKEALEWIKANIPKGKTIGNSHSTTLVSLKQHFTSI